MKKIGKKIMLVWWCLFLTFGLLLAVGEHFHENMQTLLTVITSPLVLVKNLLVIAIIIGIAVSLIYLHPVFGWSWLSLFVEKDEQDESPENLEEDAPEAKSSKALDVEVSKGVNLGILPVHIKYFGVIYAILLLMSLPHLAMIEEKWFRVGTETWVQAAYISLAFGMLHCLVGIPLAAGLALSILGLWLSHQYFIGGVELSTLHHTSYNLILVLALLIFAILNCFSDKAKAAETQVSA